MISREELAAMRERCEKATAGPWVDGYVSGICRKEHGPDEKGPWHGNGFCKHEYEVSESGDAHHLASKSANIQVAGNFDYECGGIIHPEDHDFIKHARTDLPRLLAEVERLRGVADETYRLVRLARHWIGDNAPASISKALDDYVFTHPMKSAAEGGE